MAQPDADFHLTGEQVTGERSSVVADGTTTAFQQPVVLRAYFKRRLHEREVRVVRNDGFRENGELNALFTEFKNLGDDLYNSAFVDPWRTTQ